jgi:hypothetical protein
MFVSYVLRLRPEVLREGRFAGEVEAVATGQRFPVRSLDHMMELVLDTAGEEIETARDARRNQLGES